MKVTNLASLVAALATTLANNPELSQQPVALRDSDGNLSRADYVEVDDVTTELADEVDVDETDETMTMVVINTI